MAWEAGEFIDNLRQKRKAEHIKLCLTEKQLQNSGLNCVEVLHWALPRGNFDQVDLSCLLFGKKLAFPLIINAMTGGTREAKEINRFLAQLARDFGLAMALGSQTAALENRELTDTYALAREVNPDGLIFANVGAHVKADIVEEAIKMVKADAVQIHLNLAQELAMPEGDRDFTNWARNIKEITNIGSVPVIVKEVGFGFSREVVHQLIALGVQHFDVGGKGGTNFLTVEKARYQYPPEHVTEDWGISTLCSLLETLSAEPMGIVVATGGIRRPVDMVKVLAVGANVVGMAFPFLQLACQSSYNTTKKWLQSFIMETRKLVLLSGALNLKDLTRAQIVYTDWVYQWIQQRQLNIYRGEG